jgi:hypothetical protein
VTQGADVEDISAAIRANYDAQCRAMVDAAADELDVLLAADFTLTHMTGYEQSRNEWLDDVRSGRMRYHRMHDVEVSLVPDDTAPVLTARTVTEATIWGAHGTWNLRLRIRYARVQGEWVAQQTIASTW